MTLQLCPEVSTVETADGLAILDERAGRFWQLNPTGATVLHGLLEGHSAEDVARKLAQGYPVSQEQVTADVTALVTQLSEAGLVC